MAFNLALKEIITQTMENTNVSGRLLAVKCGGVCLRARMNVCKKNVMRLGNFLCRQPD